MTDQWILDHVVPNLSKKVPVEVAKVLGRATLFCVFDSSGKAAFPSHRKEHILKLTSIWVQGISLRWVHILSRGSL